MTTWTTTAEPNDCYLIFFYNLRDYQVILHVSRPDTKNIKVAANLYQNIEGWPTKKLCYRSTLFSKDMTPNDFQNWEEAISRYKYEALTQLRREIQKDVAKAQGALLDLLVE